MINARYNKEQVVSIKVFDKKKDNWIEWYKAVKKTWFNKAEPAGFCEALGCGTRYSTQDLRAGKCGNVRYIVEGRVAYYRPYVLIKFTNDDKHYEYFETIEECKAYAETLSDELDIDWLEV